MVYAVFYINISDFFFSSLAPLTIIIIPVTIPVVSTMIPTARLHAPVEDMVLYIFSFIVILTFMSGLCIADQSTFIHLFCTVLLIICINRSFKSIVNDYFSFVLFVVKMFNYFLHDGFS